MAKRVCSVEGCDRPLNCRGWCQQHYKRWQKFGDVQADRPLGRTPRQPLDHPDGTRTCLECGERKPLSEYHKDGQAPSGHRPVCKMCRSDQMRNWYERNQDRQVQRARDRLARDNDVIRERDRARYERDKDKRLELVTATGNRRRALLRELPGGKNRRTLGEWRAWQKRTG